MTTLKIRIATAIATGAVLVSSVAPAFAATDITISGNGRDSSNGVSVGTSNTTTVTQSNVANITNNTTVNSDTGNNKANDNIGGNVSVNSGDASSNVTVKNNANSNVANVANCGCDNGASVLVSGNGRNSDNTVGLSQDNTTRLTQTNVANVTNNTTVNSNTGHNSANDNLGSNGNVTVRSGDVDSTVNVGTTVNSNAAQVGGNGATGADNGVSAKILGNGRDSDNTILLGLKNSASVDQTNVANVTNNTTVNSDTGFNKADDNLGGNVTVGSGDATSHVSVDTMANFNAAALDNCGCDMTVNAKIADNLRDSDNTIGARISNAQAAFQTSVLNGTNNTTDNSNTGHNKANDNGGALNLSDPQVTSGDAPATVHVSTSGNTNNVGTGLTLPMPGNNQVNFSFNMNQMFAAWMAWLNM